MVSVAVSKQAGLYPGKVQSEAYRMIVGVRRKIQQQRIVYHRLTAGTERPAARFSGAATILAGTEQCRDSFRSSGAKVLKLHMQPPFA